MPPGTRQVCMVHRTSNSPDNFTATFTMKIADVLFLRQQSP